MNFVDDFKKHLEADNVSGEFQNFTQDRATFTIKCDFGGLKQEVIIHPTYLEIPDSDFKSSGTSLWDDFEEVKEFSSRL